MKFKKIAAGLLSAVMLAGYALLPEAMPLGKDIAISASAYTYKDFEYAVPNGEACITGYKGKGGTVKIPSVIDGYKVTSIGDHAFGLYGNSTVKKVIIPNTVKHIGAGSFRCFALEEVTIPEGVQTIGNGAFDGCKSLKKLNIPKSVTTIDTFAFSSCKSLTSVTIPDTVKELGNGAFSSCEGLKSVTIGKNVSYLKQTFVYCKNLTSVTIPGSVKSIDFYAFQHCDNLKTVTLSEGTESIGYYAFADCQKLETVVIPKSVKEFDRTAFRNTNNCTIYGTKGSAAETFALNNGIKFKDVSTLKNQTSSSSSSLKKPQNVKASVTKNSVKLTWDKNSKADGYQVQIKKNGKWKTVATIKKNTSVSYTVKSLKSKTTYKFRVRSYATDSSGKTTYSSYTTKSAKTK